MVDVGEPPTRALIDDDVAVGSSPAHGLWHVLHVHLHSLAWNNELVAFAMRIETRTLFYGTVTSLSQDMANGRSTDPDPFANQKSFDHTGTVLAPAVPENPSLDLKTNLARTPPRSTRKLFQASELAMGSLKAIPPTIIKPAAKPPAFAGLRHTA
jgi:hypothetical protein